MSNQFAIRFFLIGIACCILVLTYMHRRVTVATLTAQKTQEIFTTPVDALTQVHYTSPNLSFNVKKTPDGWVLHSPFHARVNPTRMAQLLDALEQASLLDIISLPEIRRSELALADFGFTAQAPRLTLTSPTGEETFIIGSKTPTGNELYLQLNTHDQIFVTEAHLRAVLPTSLDDIRDRKLIRLERPLLRTLEIRTPGKPFIRLSKESGTWILVQPVEALADDTKVEALIDLLYATDVQRFVWPTLDALVTSVIDPNAFKVKAAAYGFDSDRAMHIIAQTSSITPPTRILIGEGSDMDGYYLLLPNSEEIGVISKQFVQAFHCSPDYLRDNRLFFEKPSDIKRLTMTCDAFTMVLVQQDGQWSIQAPISAKTNAKKVAETIDHLLRMTSDTTSVLSEIPSAIVPAISQVEVLSEKKTVRFTLSQDEYENPPYRFQFTNSPTAYRIETSQIPTALLSKSEMLKLCDTLVVSLPAKTINRITVRKDQKTVALAKDNTTHGWRVTDSPLAKATPNLANVQRFIAHFESIQAEWVADLGITPETLNTYGFKSPWMEITLDVDSAEAIRKTVCIGKELAFGKRYAMIRGQETVFVLDAPAIDLLSLPLIEQQVPLVPSP